LNLDTFLGGGRACVGHLARETQSNRMIIYSDKGYLVPIIWGPVLILAGGIIKLVLGGELFQRYPAVALIPCAIASAALWYVDHWIVARDQKVLDELGARVRATSAGSFFFVPMKYWSFISFIWGVVYIFALSGL
jgi:hypothetical protein